MAPTERYARRQDLLAYLDELEAQDPTDAATRARARRCAAALDDAAWNPAAGSAAQPDRG